MQLKEKSEENQKKGYPPVPQKTLDAATDIIRFEAQSKYLRTYTLTKRALQCLPTDMDVYQILLSPEACTKQILTYYSKTIGKGDWYTLRDGIKIIQSYQFNSQKEKQLLDALKLVNQCRSVAKAIALHHGKDLEVFKRTLKELSYLGINPVSIPREWEIKHIPNLLYTFLTNLQQNVRKKNGMLCRRN